MPGLGSIWILYSQSLKPILWYTPQLILDVEEESNFGKRELLTICP